MCRGQWVDGWVGGKRKRKRRKRTYHVAVGHAGVSHLDGEVPGVEDDVLGGIDL